MTKHQLSRKEAFMTMYWKRYHVAAIALCFVGVVTLSSQRTLAGDFRVQSKVFEGDSLTPFAENLTLFKGEVVYDFVEQGSREITIFDPKTERIILLDPKRKEKTVIKLDWIHELISKLRSQIQSKPSDLLNPKLESKFDEAEGWLTLSSPRITYRAKGMTLRDHSVVSRYRRFADWHAKLNAIHGGSMPPFARIKLNESIANRNMVPEVVELKMTFPKRKAELKSTHGIIWQLSAEDEKQIELVNRYLAEFRTVPLKQYGQ